MTLRQLVSHTSGFPPEGGDYWRDLRLPTLRELYDANPVIRLESAPLSAFRYSNFAIAVLGDILARTAQSPYARYVKRRIFEPLDMRCSGFDAAALAGCTVATGYSTTGATPAPVEPIALNALEPAGQAYSSANDLARFISLQFRDDAAGGGQIIGGASIREMQQPVFLFGDFADPSAAGLAIGVGWFIRDIAGTRAAGHGGGIPGFTADITIVPDLKIGIASLFSAGADPTSLNQEALEKLVSAIETARKRQRLSRAKFDGAWTAYLGEYDMAGVALLSVRRDQDQMIFVHPLDKPDAHGVMIPAGEREFLLDGGAGDGEIVRFSLDEAGAVSGLTIVGIDAIKR